MSSVSKIPTVIQKQDGAPPRYKRGADLPITRRALHETSTYSADQTEGDSSLSQNTPTTDEASCDPTSQGMQRARMILSRLHSLVMMVATDVEQHSSDVEANSRELAAFSELLGSRDNILESVAVSLEKVITNNKKLKNQLLSAELTLEQQKLLIDVHLTDALTDPLTGLPNRRAFDDALRRQIAQWSRMNTPFAVLLIDLDQFKEINDRCGHLAGDAVLRGVSRMTSVVLRDMDLLARYGGDELIAILPETDLAGGENAALRVQALASISTYPVDDVVLKATLSIGLTVVHQGDTFESVIKRADKALYCSKNDGRNCIHLHDGITCRRVDAR